MKTYKFKLTQEQKEAIYSAVLLAPYDDQTHTRELYEITRSSASEITLTAEQLSVVLKYMQSAIDHYENLGDDWLRAADYKKAREYLIAETRKRFKLV